MENGGFTEADKRLIQRLTERTYFAEPEETILNTIHRLFKEFIEEYRAEPKEITINLTDFHALKLEANYHFLTLSLADDPFGDTIMIYGAKLKIDLALPSGAYRFTP